MTTLPVVDELLQRLSALELRFVPQDYPVKYAHKLIEDYPQIIPSEVLSELFQEDEPDSIGAYASILLNIWSKQAESNVYELAAVLAETYIELNNVDAPANLPYIRSMTDYAQWMERQKKIAA